MAHTYSPFVAPRELTRAVGPNMLGSSRNTSQITRPPRIAESRIVSQQASGSPLQLGPHHPGRLGRSARRSLFLRDTREG